MVKDRCGTLDLSLVGTLIDRKLLSWAELARVAGISPATIFALKAGRRNASYRTIRKIAAALDIEPTDIMKKD